VDSFLPQAALREEIAVVVPVYFTRVSDAVIESLLWMTLVDLPAYVPPAQTWILIDGDERSAAIARQVVDRLAAPAGRMHLVANSENRGKLAVIRQGMRLVLSEQPHVRFLAVIDGDGDHLPAALPGLVRAAASMEQAYGHGRVIAIGARLDRARAMGWVRGQLETLLDQLTLDALTYRLAWQGRALDLSQSLAGRVPDLSSGYKVYLRECAALLFGGSEPETGALSPWAYWHYGPETVTLVEAVQAGAVFGEMLRPSWDGQPVSSFAEFNAVAMYASLLTWVWARLGLAPEVAATHYDNRRAGMALGTTTEGAAMLAELRSRALQPLYGAEPLPPPHGTLPFI